MLLSDPPDGKLPDSYSFQNSGRKNHPIPVWLNPIKEPPHLMGLERFRRINKKAADEYVHPQLIYWPRTVFNQFGWLQQA